MATLRKYSTHTHPMEYPRRLIKPVTVSVVSHKQAGLVADLLRDLSEHSGQLIEKVILTYNVEEMPTVNQAGLSFPIQEIHNEHPRGFGANHNKAFLSCDTDWFLIVNPDIRIASDVISDLFERANERSGILAPQELSPDGLVVNNVRGLITPLELFQRQVLKQPAPTPVRSGWVKGMFMLVRAKAYSSVHGFDERYFLYCEDFDLCARLLLGGWAIDHHRDIVVTHTWQRQSHESWQPLRRHLQSLWSMWMSSTYWRYRSHLQRNEE